MRLDTARALTPLKVHFTCKDMTVTEAVAAFAKQTGHPINLTGNVNNLANRRITLDTGDTSFWEAYQQLCAKAGIREMEVPEQPQPNGDIYGGRNIRVMRGGLRGNVVYYGGPRMALDETLVLEDGAAQPGAVVRSGSLRIRSIAPKSAVFADLPDGGKQITLNLEVRSEARMELMELIGVRITRATDPSGRKIRSASDYTQNGPSGLLDPDMQFLVMQGAMIYDGGSPAGATRQAPITVTIDGKAVPSLGELSGVLAARVKTAPEALIAIDDLSKAVGNSKTAADGSEIKITECKREDDGLFKVKVELKSSALRASPEEQMLMTGMGRGRGLANPGAVQLNKDDPQSVPFKLFNVDGKPLQLVTGEMQIMANNDVSRVFSMVYKPGEKDSAPAKLEYIGRREVLIEVPFTLKDVPLLPNAK
jgi:hypothetical protein